MFSEPSSSLKLRTPGIASKDISESPFHVEIEQRIVRFFSCHENFKKERVQSEFSLISSMAVLSDRAFRRNDVLDLLLHRQGKYFQQIFGALNCLGF